MDDVIVPEDDGIPWRESYARYLREPRHEGDYKEWLWLEGTFLEKCINGTWELLAIELEQAERALLRKRGVN
jgi:hypothetical protein